MQTIRRVTLGKYAYIENVLVPNHYNAITGSGYFFVEPEKKGHVTCLFACFGNVHANMRLYPRIIQFACYLIDSDARFSFPWNFTRNYIYRVADQLFNASLTTCSMNYINKHKWGTEIPYSIQFLR